MKFIRSFIAVFFIFLILNDDVLIKAHTLSKVQSSIEMLANVEKVSEALEESRNDAEKGSKLSRYDKKHHKNIVQTKSKIEPITISILVIIGVIFVAGLIKRAYTKSQEKHLKEISNAISAEKLQQLTLRKKENKFLINSCLGFQNLRKLFKGYSVLSLTSLQETKASLDGLAGLTGVNAPAKAQLLSAAATAAANVLSQWDRKSIDLEDKLDQAFGRFCHDGYKVRQNLADLNVLGEYYTGFSQEEFSKLDAAKDVVKDTILEEKFGAETTSEVLSLVSEEELNNKAEGWSIWKDGTPSAPWLQGYTSGASIFTSLKGLKDNYNELKTKWTEYNGDSTNHIAKWYDLENLSKGFDYLALAFSTLDKIQKLVSVGASFAGKDFSLPFFSAATEGSKTLSVFLSYIKLKKDFKADRTNKGLELQVSLKFWDLMDQFFSFANELASLIMNFLTVVTVGVSKLISYSITAFISILQCVFAAVKRAKIIAMKQGVIDYVRGLRVGQEQGVDASINTMKDEKCATYGSFLKSVIEKEMDQIDDIIEKKTKSLAELKASLKPESQQNAAAQILAKKATIVETVCQKDKVFCPEFLENIDFDLSFINTHGTLPAEIAAISLEKAHGQPNSIVSVFKGMYWNQEYTSDEKTYTKELFEGLINNDYYPVFDSPRYAIFVCSLCYKNENSLAEIENFKQNTEIRADAQFVYYQDTLQFGNTDAQNELAEYVVGKFKAKTSDTKFTEITFKGDVTTSERSWIFFKHDKLNSADFRLPILSQKTKDIHLRTLNDFAFLSIHQQFANEVIEFLKTNVNINIITSTTIMKLKHDFPGHFFFLVGVKSGLNLATELATKCSGATGAQAYKCVYTSLKTQYNALDKNFDYNFFFMLTKHQQTKRNPVVDNTAKYESGITVAGFTNAGWSEMHTISGIQLSKDDSDKEVIEVKILKKPTMRYKAFPTKTTPEGELGNVLNSAESTARTNLFKTLKETACSAECKYGSTKPNAQSPDIPFITLKHDGATEKNVCLLSDPEWVNLIKHKLTAPYKAKSCTFETEHKTKISNYWESIVKGFVTTPSKTALQVLTEITC